MDKFLRRKQHRRAEAAYSVDTSMNTIHSANPVKAHRGSCKATALPNIDVVAFTRKADAQHHLIGRPVSRAGSDSITLHFAIPEEDALHASGSSARSTALRACSQVDPAVSEEPRHVLAREGVSLEALVVHGPS